MMNESGLVSRKHPLTTFSLSHAFFRSPTLSYVEGYTPALVWWVECVGFAGAQEGKPPFLCFRA